MLQKQVDGMEKQRNYLMRKLQDTKNNMETEKFQYLKEFEVEKLDLLKKIEELLMLNDILAGQKMIYDMKGKKIDTHDILSMLNPFQLIKNVHEKNGKTGSKRDFSGIKDDSQVTIKDIVNNISQKYIETKSVECMTFAAIRDPLTSEVWYSPLDESLGKPNTFL